MSRRRTLPAWLAILAMALQALWPLVAQAKPPSAGLLVPVCTVSGDTHYVALPGSESPLDKRSAAQLEHCQLCVSADDRAAIAPGPCDEPIACGDGNGARIPRDDAATVAPPFHPASRPRGPPAVS